MRATLTKRHHTLFTVLKLLIFLGSLAFIYFKLKDHAYINDIFLIRLELLWLTSPWYLMVLPVLLMPLNWLLEALKWKLLSAKIEKISLWRAFASVLAGLGLSFITPHAVGDYAGKILYSSAGERGRLMGAVLLGRLLQLLATLFFGIWGLMYYFVGGVSISTLITALVSFILIAALGITLLQMLILAFGIRSTIGRWINKYFGILADYTWKEVLLVQMVAMLRYFVFATQFYIILLLFDIGLLPAITTAGISWTLLLKSVLPTFNFLSDLGVREAAALLFFEGYTTISSHIILASFMLWLLNILLPAIVGLLFIFRLKLKASMK
jgi:hypothetical protein